MGRVAAQKCAPAAAAKSTRPAVLGRQAAPTACRARERLRAGGRGHAPDDARVGRARRSPKHMHPRESVEPEAWASEPSCGAGTRSQPGQRGMPEAPAQVNAASCCRACCTVACCTVACCTFPAVGSLWATLVLRQGCAHSMQPCALDAAASSCQVVVPCRLVSENLGKAWAARRPSRNGRRPRQPALCPEPPWCRQAPWCSGPVTTQSFPSPQCRPPLPARCDCFRVRPQGRRWQLRGAGCEQRPRCGGPPRGRYCPSRGSGKYRRGKKKGRKKKNDFDQNEKVRYSHEVTALNHGDVPRSLRGQR